LKKILYVCNTAGIAARFRLPVFKGALAHGYDVACICGDGVDAEAHRITLASIGVTVLRLPGLEADGLSLGQLLAQSKAIGAIIDGTKPDIVHAFTHRANIASYLALRNRPGIRFIPNITGAGRFFGSDLTLRDRLAQSALLRFYRAMGNRCECIFFQNEDDLDEIGSAMQVPAGKLRLTGGSGFDPREIKFDQLLDRADYRRHLSDKFGISEGKKMFLFPSRALISKGVREFYAAASRYLALFDDAVFVHAGEAGQAPYGWTKDELKAHQRPGLHFIGFQTDIFRLVGASDAIVLPSAYREGIPRSLIEALYFGKMLITTDNTGCRETVIDGWNGVLFKPRSSQALLTAFVAAQRLDIHSVYDNSRKLFENRFHADTVVKIYLDQYGRV
jgi:N,N'-diacetylbacillosaminyl-diphospho-undecaprenol alpha-1,3-N-acetylgalactosaminyltransferase